MSSIIEQDQDPRHTGRFAVSLLLAVLGLAVLLRTQYISSISFWFDESCSWKISQFGWGEMLDAISRDAHPPLYYIALKGWGAAIGDGPATVRGLSVVLGLATVVAAYLFVKEASTQQVGPASVATQAPDWQFPAVLAAMLVASSALHVELSLEARPYTLGTFLALVGGTALLRAIRPEGSAVAWCVFAVAAVLLSLTHYYALFTVAALFLFAGGVLCRELWRTGWNRTTKRLLAGTALSAWGVQAVWAIWFPVFWFQRERADQQLWMGPLDWKMLAETCWKALAGGTGSPSPAGWAWTAVVAWGLLITLLMIWGGRAGRLAAVCAGAPLAGVIAYSLAVRNILGVRYLIFAQVSLLVGTALLIGRFPGRAGRVILAGALLSWTGWWCWQHSAEREFQAGFPGARGAVAHLDRVRSPGDPVIVSSPFVHTIVLQYTEHPAGILARYDGDHRREVLSGPALRESDLLDSDALASLDAERVWTIEAAGLFGGLSFVRLPDDYRSVSEKRFPQRFGHRMDVIIREHVREARAASATD